MRSARYIDWYGKGRAQNWRTPRALFDRLHAEFVFTLDGASEPGNGLVPLASTAEQPIAWAGHRVFCNPPWSNIRPFIEMAPQARLAVFLVPARTNVAWFHRALELGATPRFFAGRPRFELDTHEGKGHNSPVDCMFLVFGDGELRDCGACGALRIGDSHRCYDSRFYPGSPYGDIRT